MKYAIIISIAALALGAFSAQATDELDAATKERVERFEKGPATIDVSKYPQGLQDNYQVFATKCTQCHKLSRPINSDYALPDEWSRYVKRMMYKPGSNISSSEAKQIFEFLAYDSSIRKKAMYDEKLAKLSADEKTAAEKKIADLHAKYDK